MGPSGSGKSTLMHIIGCLDVPTAGTYRLAGEDVGEMDEVDLAEIRNRRIGFVFQQFNLLPSLSAWRNVELPLTYAGVPRDERKAGRSRRWSGSGWRIGSTHRPGELSGGQQQRVAVARALVTDPALILADEPTGNLDSVATADVLALFDELHEQGRTIVLITHEAEVAQRAHRIIRVRDGVIVGLAPGAVRPGWGPRSRGPRGHRCRSGGERMTWLETLRTGWDAIRAHRLRSGLTMLGILIGIAAVVLTVGLGLGSQQEVGAQISSLGSNLLIVSPGSSTTHGGRARRVRLGVDADHRRRGRAGLAGRGAGHRRRRADQDRARRR